MTPSDGPEAEQVSDKVVDGVRAYSDDVTSQKNSTTT